MAPLPRRIAVIGTGTLGASWTALFLAHGLDVAAQDPAPGAEDRLHAFLDHALPQLAELGQTGSGRLTFSADLGAALQGADFVQENATENEALKQALLAEIDALAPASVTVASSTSALVLSVIVRDCTTKGRFIAAHPFNPPHLVPLVEITGTDVEVVAGARAFYEAVGRRCIVLRREMPGHIANRLASALYQEAVHLVESGVASVADVDAALCHGPGLRWAIMGPHMAYHLGGGEGGIARYLHYFSASQLKRWRALGTSELGPEVQAAIVAGIAEESAGRTLPELERQRDRALIEALKLRRSAPPIS